ncbi:MAG: IS110 family transposase [Ferruginibacter sp.]
MPTTNLIKTVDFSGQKFYVGLDVHKKSWTVTIRSSNMGIEHFTQPPSSEALVKHLHNKYPGAEYYSAYEAGFCGTTIHEQLVRYGINNIVINPADLPSTDKEKKNKTDVHDSRSICKNLEKGNLRCIHILSVEQQELRAMFRQREVKVRDVTRSINRLKSFLTFFGVDYLAVCSKNNELFTARVIKKINSVSLSTESGTLVLKEYVETLLYNRRQLLEITQGLKQQIQRRFANEYRLLLSIPGIGSITAMAFLCEIGDFKRFKDPDEYCSFIGLTPWNNSSGDSISVIGIQPRCNKHLRPLIVEASWTAIRKDTALLLYYKKHAVKNSKYAIIKVARKLAMIVKGVMRRGESYQPNYQLAA